MTSVDLPVPAQDAELVRLKDQADRVLIEAQSIEVLTGESRDYAVAYLAEIAKVKKAAESRRATLVSPLNDAVKAVNVFVKGLLAPVEKADGLLRQRVLTYHQEQARQAEAERRRQEEERRRAEKEARQKADEARRKLEEAVRLERAAQADKDAALQAEAKKRLDEALAAEHAAQEQSAEADKPVVAPALPSKTFQTGMGSATVKKVWTYEVTDLRSVPWKFLLLNTVAVQEAIRNGARDIDGLRIFQREELAVRQ